MRKCIDYYASNAKEKIIILNQNKVLMYVCMYIYIYIYILAGRPASPRASTERLNINSLENRNALSGCFPLRTSRHDWSVPDQSKRFVSPTNGKAPFDGSEELRVPIGRTIRTLRSAARPIGRFLLTGPKNSASRLVGC